MSEEVKAEGDAKGVRREQIRVRLDKLRRSRQHGILGVPEIVGLASSALLVLAVVFAYLFFLSPARARLKRSQDERALLQERIREAQRVGSEKLTTEASVAEIGQSLVTFENQYLAHSAPGRMSLYEKLNELIRRNSLRNTAGPAYMALEPLGSEKAASGANRSGNARWQSIYPGIGITVTVEGQYANLRRFMREIESSNQFIIINAVELEGATETESPTGASLVSLRLDMATYFRREASATDVLETETR